MRVLFSGWLAIMVLLPFHGFISTWGGTAIGPLPLWKVWKEVLLVGLLLVAIFILIRSEQIRKYVLASWIVRLGTIYSALHIVISLLLFHDLDATLYGLAINLRFLLFFGVSLVVFSSLQLSRKSLLKILLVPAAVVVGFGILQYFVLPTDFLAQFGYDKNSTIDPMPNIDEQADQVRLLSTLRGPNPLGAYLILPGVVLVGLLLRTVTFTTYRFRIETWGRILGFVSFFGTLLLVLYGSHSRSAWLAFVVSVAVYLLFMLKGKARTLLIIVGLLGATFTLGLVYQYRNTTFVQNVILHDNPETGAEVTSNSAHSVAITEGLTDITKKPLTGCAPGCAGPASYYNEEGGHIAENYYIQVGQEVGVFGLLLLLVIMIIIFAQLYRLRADPLALALLASFVGISAANMLLHTWADDTLAYVWWGMAGAVIASKQGFHVTNQKTFASKRR